MGASLCTLSSGRPWFHCSKCAMVERSADASMCRISAAHSMHSSCAHEHEHSKRRVMRATAAAVGWRGIRHRQLVLTSTLTERASS